MEPNRFDYSPIVDRPRIAWPHGARVALWVAPNIEHYEFLPPRNPYQNPWPRVPHPDILNYARMDYGNRVGLWRLMEVFDRHELRCTAALNVAVLEHYPEIREAMLRRNWDFMSHGIYNTQYLWGVSEEAERTFFEDTKDTLMRLTGKRLKGMLGPALTNSERTVDLLADAGLCYHADWFHDDQPFPLKTRNDSRVISMPYSIETNDGVMNRQGFEADYFSQIIKDQFDVLYEEGAQNGQVMCIALHPYWSGRPNRIKYLDDAFSYILSHEYVWKTTADDIADYYLEHYYDSVREHIQVKSSEGL